MQFDYAYSSSTAVHSGAGNTDMSFAPDTLREPTYFSGVLRQGVAFREAISALHDVVVSDLRFKPKDKTEYLAWLAQQDERFLQEAAQGEGEVALKVAQLQGELDELNRKFNLRRKEFWSARALYYKYLYKVNRDAWFVLDPVITVHPDQVFFECFSQDESSYGRLSAGYEVFKDVGEFACGTTNVDYSAALYDEFQKIRSYKTTKFEVDPSGFEVHTEHEESYKEVKIDLPDSWVRGFLQVSSAMSLPSMVCDLHPMDVHNFCFVLRRLKEKHGPRSMRWQLKPGQPISVVFEPWELTVPCPRSTYLGEEEIEVRMWGRRRLLILERLIAVAKRFRVHLLGQGLPSFWLVDLGDMTFTLGLSGWTANDWSTAGNFDLMAPRAEVDDATKQVVFAGLKETWLAEPGALAKKLNLDRSVVLGALGAYTQAGRAIYDLVDGVYRVRELSRDPLPMDKLRFANPRDEAATRFLDANAVRIARIRRQGDRVTIEGKLSDKKELETSLTLDGDQRLVEGECACNWHQQNKLYKGPCEHILALRMAFARREKGG